MDTIVGYLHICRHMGVQYASPGKWPLPKHTGEAEQVKDHSSAAYRVVIVEPHNMWDKPDTQLNSQLKQEEDKDDAVLNTPSASTSNEDIKSTTEEVRFRTDTLCAMVDLCSEAGNIHKLDDHKTHNTNGGNREEFERSCSTTRKLPNSIISAFDRRRQLSVSSGPNGETATSGDVEVDSKTEESGGRKALVDTDAEDSLLIHDVNEESTSSGDCTSMDSDTPEVVPSGDHAVESQRCQSQEHELVMEHASSNTQDCFISSFSPPVEASEMLPTDNCSAPVAACQRPPAPDESLSEPVVQSPNTPSQLDRPLTDGVGPQGHTPVNCQSPPPDAPCWLTPLLTAPGSPNRLLVFSDHCKQHRLVKGMMAEVRMQHTYIVHQLLIRMY